MADTMSRRGFVETMGVASVAGLAASIPVVKLAQAEEGTASEASDSGKGAGQTPAEREAAAAFAENRRMNYLRYCTDKSTDEIDAMLADEAEVTEDYVTPSGKVIPAVYVRLRNRINRIHIGIGAATTGDDHWDVFMNHLTEDEALAMVQMPFNKFFTAEEMANSCGRSEQECLELCESLAYRGWMFCFRRAGVPYFLQMTSIPGYWEGVQMDYLMKGETEKAIEWIENVETSSGADSINALKMFRSFMHIQPPSRDIVDGELNDYTDWEKTIDRHERFAVMPCKCRQKRDTLGTRTCTDNHPLETCMSVGEAADYFLECGVARELTREEAKEVIRNNIEHGYVIEATITKAGGAFCACHHDCCQLLGKFRMLYDAHGFVPTTMPFLSDYNLSYDKEACIQCGACVERCPMASITLDDEGYCVMDPICVRCGQCATVCPAGARKLVPKPIYELFEYPQDQADDFLTSARGRMALGFIKDFTGDVSIFEGEA